MPSLLSDQLLDGLSPDSELPQQFQRRVKFSDVVYALEEVKSSVNVQSLSKYAEWNAENGSWPNEKVLCDK